MLGLLAKCMKAVKTNPQPAVYAADGMILAQIGGMARIGRNIGLTWMYGKWIILAGGLYNLVCAAFLAAAFSYMGLVDAFFLKVLFTGVVLYLHRQFEDRDAVFFYINLGLSRKRLMAATLSIDFGFLLLLGILIALCR